MGTHAGDEVLSSTRTAEKGYDADGRKTLNQYTFLKVLARGTLAKVKLARHSGEESSPAADSAAAEMKEELFAVKIYSRRKLSRRKAGTGLCRSPFSNTFAREARVLRELGAHRNIVKLVEYICKPSIDKVYLVMEYLEGGPCLGKWNPGAAEFVGGPLSEANARCVFSDVMAGLSHMHSHAIAHCDIKPENILCTTSSSMSQVPDDKVSRRQRYVICDLASAKRYEDTHGHGHGTMQT